MIKRCDWVTTDPIYIDYHDTEWGVPVHDDNYKCKSFPGHSERVREL